MVNIKDFGPVKASYLPHSTNDVVRFQASSGGFIKSFLAYLLDYRKVDFAIVTRTGGPDNPLTPETIVTNSVEEVLSPRTNSVYAVHNVLHAMKGLQQGSRYALVALPCQVKELRLLRILAYTPEEFEQKKAEIGIVSEAIKSGTEMGGIADWT